MEFNGHNPSECSSEDVAELRRIYEQQILQSEEEEILKQQGHMDVTQPTFSEIMTAKCMLEATFQSSLIAIITALGERQNQQLATPPSNITTLENNQIDRDTRFSNEELSHLLKKKKYLSEKDILNQKERFSFATLFAEKGYSQGYLEETSKNNGSSISPLRYKVICRAIVTESFRVLERFILSMCNKQIQFLNSRQFQLILNYLLRLYEDPDLKETEIPQIFSKFIKLNYSIEPVLISYSQAIKLHQTLLNKFKERKHELPTLSSKIIAPRRQRRQSTKVQDAAAEQLELKTIALKQQIAWIPAVERDFIVAFLKHQAVWKVRDVFKSKYKHSYHLTDLKYLNRRFRRLIRQTVRQLQNYCDLHQIGIKKLDDDMMKNLFTSKIGEKLRKRLLEVKLHEGQCQNKIAEAIRESEEYYKNRTEMRDRNRIIETARSRA